MNQKSLRAHVVSETAFEPKFRESYKWVLDTPREIRDGAVKDFLESLANAKAKGEQFRLNYRTLKKQHVQSIVIDTNAWSKQYPGVFYQTHLGKQTHCVLQQIAQKASQSCLCREYQLSACNCTRSWASSTCVSLSQSKSGARTKLRKLTTGTKESSRWTPACARS